MDMKRLEEKERRVRSITLSGSPVFSIEVGTQFSSEKYLSLDSFDRNHDPVKFPEKFESTILGQIASGEHDWTYDFHVQVFENRGEWRRLHSEYGMHHGEFNFEEFRNWKEEDFEDQIVDSTFAEALVLTVIFRVWTKRHAVTAKQQALDRINAEQFEDTERDTYERLKAKYETVDDVFIQTRIGRRERFLSRLQQNEAGGEVPSSITDEIRRRFPDVP